MTQDNANHDAVPAAIAVSDEDRTDKAATSHRRDRSGDTPVTEPMPKEKPAEVCVVAENATTTLTNAEREAILRAIDIYEMHWRLEDADKAVALRGLLERVGGK